LGRTPFVGTLSWVRDKNRHIQAENPDPGCGAAINEDKTNCSGEKLAGLRLKGHFPEKDGALAGLLSEAFVAEASLSEQLAAIDGSRGPA
jgi:hypothetical protein